jgi:hypothetical protein
MKTELEEAAEKYAEEVCNGQFPIEYTRQQVVNHTKNDFIQGAKWQAEKIPIDINKKWSEYRIHTNNEDAWCFKEWLVEQFKKNG